MSTKSKKSRQTRPAVFVEIGPHWVKAIRTEAGGPPSAISRAVMMPCDPLQMISADSLRTALESLKASECDIYACLPRQSVTLRMLDLPSSDAAEVADMIDLQVGRQTPYSRNEILFDYRATGGGRRGYTRVLLAIVQRSVLRSRYSLLEEAGATVTRMTISTEGVAGWYAGSHRSAGGESVMIMDVDAGYTDIVVMDSGRPIFSRSILIGAVNLISQGGTLAERLVRETQNSLTALSAEAPDVTVSKVLLTGAAARNPMLSEIMGQALEIPVEAEDSLSSAASLPKKPDLASETYAGASMTPLIGMAVGRDDLVFDLVPESVSIRRKIVERAKGLSRFGALTVLLMMVLSVYGVCKVALKQAEMKRVQQVLEEAVSRAEQIDKKKLLIQQVDAHRDVRHACINVIEDIYRRIPELADVTFESFNYDYENARVQLGGTGRSTRDIRALLNELEASSLLGDVKEEGTTRLDRNTRRYTFKLDCSLEGLDAG